MIQYMRVKFKSVFHDAMTSWGWQWTLKLIVLNKCAKYGRTQFSYMIYKMFPNDLKMKEDINENVLYLLYLLG